MNTFLTSNDEKTCYGCLSCVYSCNSGAISISERFDKFLYPQIDASKCIGCDLCKKVCPYDSAKTNKIKATYALIHNNDEVRANSTSGGAFTAFSDVLLKKGYIIYGAGYDSEFKVVHKKAEDFESRNSLRGSKYVESSLENIFPDIKKVLENEGKVFFVGTACQVAGLKLFLKKSYDNLITMDLMCKGVNSPKVFEDYLKLLSNGNRIKSFSFRNKQNRSWENSYKVHMICDGEINHKYDETYYRLFSRGVCLRKSCSACKFASVNRPGDITVGDFWSIDFIDSDMNDHKGTSFLAINSEKGFDLLKQLDNVKVVETELNKTINSKNELTTPTEKSYISDMFWKYYKKNSAEKTFNIYGGDSLYSKLRRKPFEYINRFLSFDRK